jgi:hypothetical protein
MNKLCKQVACTNYPGIHNITLLGKSQRSHPSGLWYLWSLTIEHGWSRNVLVHQIESKPL